MMMYLLVIFQYCIYNTLAVKPNVPLLPIPGLTNITNTLGGLGARKFDGQ